MTLQDLLILLMNLCDHLWSCMVVTILCRPALSCVVSGSPVWFYMILFAQIWSHMFVIFLHDSVCSCLALQGSVISCFVPFSVVWTLIVVFLSCLILYSLVRICLTYATIHNMCYTVNFSTTCATCELNKTKVESVKLE